MKKAWRGLGQVKLTLALFLFLAVSSIIGTVVPQGGDPASHLQNYGESIFRWLNLLGLLDLFHSWWFIFILSLLCLNLVACSIQRLPSLVRPMSSLPMPSVQEGEKADAFRRSWSGLQGDPRVQIEEFLRQRGYAIRAVGESPPGQIFASKGRWSRIGPYVVHLSVLIILLGATIGSLFGFRGYVNILEGETIDSFQLQNRKGADKLGFSLRCDDFEATYYEGTGRPKDYRSDLTVIEGGREVMKKVVRVNEPLIYKGISFYQSSFGSSGEVKSVTLLLENTPPGEESLRFKVPMGKPYPLAGTGWSVQMLRFLPDFALDEHLSPFSRSEKFNNPAAEVEIRKGDRLVSRTWAFARFRGFHPGEKDRLHVGIIDYEVPQYTGLQVGFDPGLAWVWFGFSLMLIGLTICLFGSEKRIWIQIAREGENRKVQLAGQSRRREEAFAREWNEISAGLDAIAISCLDRNA